MGYKVLYRKYRPDSFDNVVGQDYTIKMLKNAIISNRNSHAYIFTGPRGTGKTSSAKIFAKALNCENPIDGNPCGKCNSCINFASNPDIIEIDAASNNGVDEIRELINNVKLVPSNSKYKVYIIDEVHMLTASAFNALLLTLEEPPSHVVFILATTDIQDVPITILSRCQRFDFKPVSRSKMCDRLRFICDEENIDATDDALLEISKIAAGGMRDALGMLDQLSSNGSEITRDVVSSYFGSVSDEKIDELLTSTFDNNSNDIISQIKGIKENGTNYAVFIEKVIERLRNVAIDISSGKSKYNVCFDDIYSFVVDLNECLTNINLNVDPFIIIEMTFLKNMNRVNSEKYFPGNNSTDSNILGNNDVSVIKNVESKPKKASANKEKLVINKCPYKIDVAVRINNCFVAASKEYKSKVTDSWVDFMNYLIKKDRSLVSILADCVVLAASDKYILLSAPVTSTIDLVNDKIDTIEGLYSEFLGNNYRFAAISSDLWKKEVEKYRNNVKNKIKYSYMEESISSNIDSIESEVDESTVSDDENIEDVAKDIFGTFEVNE